MENISKNDIELEGGLEKNDTKDKYILYIADVISIGPLAILLVLFYISINNFRLQEFILAIILIFLNYVVTFIKNLPYPESLYKITRRPEKSFNCDYLSRNGKQSKDAPGFPSGHMTSVAFFAVYQIMNGYSIHANVLIVLLTGWARWYKNNHNSVQIIVGTIFGSILSYFYCKI
jgi:membrane-associated phospholipid phosphatase